MAGDSFCAYPHVFLSRLFSNLIALRDLYSCHFAEEVTLKQSNDLDLVSVEHKYYLAQHHALGI